MFEAVNRYSLIEVPIEDTAFEMQIVLESPVYVGNDIALLLYPQDGSAPIENPLAESTAGYDKYLWDLVETIEDRDIGDTLTLTLNASALKLVDLEDSGLSDVDYTGRLRAQAVLYDTQNSKRLEAIQPGFLKIVTTITH